jgi:hypothetical protein
MLLFHKRTKKAIKIVWGFISIVIVLSMVVTYSGFTMLAGTATSPPTTTDLNQEALDLLAKQQQSATTSARQEVPITTNASNTVKLATTTPAVPPAKPVKQLDFSL